jgi:hypothetical protein
MSWKGVAIYSVTLEEKIISYVMIFLPYEHTHAIQKLKEIGNVVVWREYVEIEEALRRLARFTKKGRLKVGEKMKFFAAPSTDINYVNVNEKGNLPFLNDMWSAVVFRAQATKSVETYFKKYTFTKLAKLIQRETGRTNLFELTQDLTGLPGECCVDSGRSPVIWVYAPLYAKLKKSASIDKQIRVYVKASKDASEKIRIHILLKQTGKEIELIKRKLTELKEIETQGPFVYYEYRYDLSAELEKGEVWIFDSKNIRRDWDHFTPSTKNLRDGLGRQLKLIGHFRKAIPLTALTFSLGFAIWGIYESIIKPLINALFFSRDIILPPTEPLLLTQVALAIATASMAYETTKMSRLSSRQLGKELAQKALDDYLIPLKSNLETMSSAVSNENTIKIDSKIVPEAYLRHVIAEVEPSLLMKLKTCLKEVDDYNISVNPKVKNRLNKNIKNLERSVDYTISKLCCEFGISPSTNP